MRLPRPNWLVASALHAFAAASVANVLRNRRLAVALLYRRGRVVHGRAHSRAGIRAHGPPLHLPPSRLGQKRGVPLDDPVVGFRLVLWVGWSCMGASTSCAVGGPFARCRPFRCRPQSMARRRLARKPARSRANPLRHAVSTPALQAGGRRFEPGTLHFTKDPLSGVFSYSVDYPDAAKSGVMESGWKEGRPDSCKDPSSLARAHP